MKKNHYLVWFCLIIVLGCLLSVAKAQTPLSVNVNWRADRNVSTNSTYSLNLFSAPNPSLITTAYLNNLDYMNPGLVRIHSIPIVDPSTNPSSWLNADGVSWNATKINQVFTNLGNHGGDLLMGMPGWPSAFNTSTSNQKLDPAKVTAYANLCASLVSIINAPGSGHYVQYWEPFNEKENLYYDNATNSTALTPLADIYNQCAVAMKNVDPTIIVGGPALQNPYPTANNAAALDKFIVSVNNAGNLGFFSYHNYGTTGSNIPAVSAYNGAKNIGVLPGTYRTKLTTDGVSATTPIYIGETNIYDVYSHDGTNHQMIKMVGAIFDALVMKYAVENGNAASVIEWNEKDGNYGKTLGNDTINPGGRLLSALNQYFVGTQVYVTTANSTVGEVFAVKNGDKKRVMLINRSDTSSAPAVNVAFTIDFNGWAPTASSYTIYTISGTSGSSSITSTTGTWTGNPTITVNANTIRFIEFTDVQNPNQLTRYPEADTYVKESAPTTNYGLATSLFTYGKVNQNTEGLIRFDVSGIPGSITSAKIRLYPTVLNGTANQRLDQVLNNTWTETGTWWSNRPAATGVFLNTWTPVLYVAAETDVTALVQAAAGSSDPKVSFHLSSTAGADMRYGSREERTEYRPELVIIHN